MADLKIYSQQGKEVGTFTLKGELWEEKVNSHVLHLALRRYLAGKRAGTHSTKNRSEVSGSGKKPWKQKGTGRARSGSIRSPLWRHGGVIFGPRPRKHRLALPKQVRWLSIRSAFRNLVDDQKLIVLEKLEISQVKTKSVLELLQKFNVEKVLILTKNRDEKLLLATRNLPNAKCVDISRLNVHDLLRFKKVFTTQETLKALEEVIA